MKEKSFPDESEKTRRARKKIAKRFREYDSSMNLEELEKAGQRIKQRIQRKTKDRVAVAKEGFALFDNNENSVEMSTATKKFQRGLSLDSST